MLSVGQVGLAKPARQGRPDKAGVIKLGKESVCGVATFREAKEADSWKIVLFGVDFFGTDFVGQESGQKLQKIACFQ